MEKFYDKIVSIADKHAPLKQKRVKSGYKLQTLDYKEIKQSSYDRDYLKSKLFVQNHYTMIQHIKNARIK